MIKNLLLILLCCIFFLNASAQRLRIAVAANAQYVIKKLQADFERKTGIETEVIIGSSGKLAAQIKNGAPYDLFLSADMQFAELLFKAGFGITKPREYASGSLIICGRGNVDLKRWQNQLGGNSIKKMAIANPKLAPYGAAAEQALRRYNLWDKMQSKLVFGESIAQVNTYITTGTVPLGFTTEALIHEYSGQHKLNWQRIDPKAYEKIRQGMIVLSHAKNGNYKQAMAFYSYLSSAAAKSIFIRNGYLVP
jgi:molybdate transport system substrate-binding protein